MLISINEIIILIKLKLDCLLCILVFFFLMWFYKIICNMIDYIFIKIKY